MRVLMGCIVLVLVVSICIAEGKEDFPESSSNNVLTFNYDNFEFEPGVGFYCPKCNSVLRCVGLKEINPSPNVIKTLVEMANPQGLEWLKYTAGSDLPRIAYACSKCKNIYYDLDSRPSKRPILGL